MGRKKFENEKKRKRIVISMDKSIYFYLKEHKIKVSTYINQMLKVATGVGSTGYTPNTAYTNSLPLVRTRSGVQIPSGA